MSHRVEQLNSLIQKDIGSIISRTLELNSGVLATVSRVSTSPDLKTARVFVTVMPHTEAGAVMRILKRNGARLQQELCKGLTMKFSPKIRFELDEGAIAAGRIEDVFNEIHAKDAQTGRKI